MDIPDDLKYLESHEWHRFEADVVTIGITQFAADELTDITYVELPKVGKTIKAGDTFGEIESVKATADLNVGVGGEVIQTNARLADEPELINNHPFADGWMIRVRTSHGADRDNLLTASEYRTRIAL